MADNRIAAYIAQAETDLEALKAHGPDEAAYLGLSTSALAHAVTAALIMTDELITPPGIPGLPPGYRLATQQDTRGARKWGYVLNGPDGGEFVSRYTWASSEAALSAGILDAKGCATAEPVSLDASPEHP